MDSASMMRFGIQALLTFVILIFLVYPFVLSAANRVINRFWAPYWRTLATVILVGIAAVIADFVVGRVAGTRDPWVMGVVGVIVTALAGGGIMNGLVRHKDGEPIGYQRAALACLVLGIVVVLIGAALTPWQKDMQAKLKANLPAAATTAATAPAASAPALATSVAPAITVTPAARSAPAAAASTPAGAASTH